MGEQEWDHPIIDFNILNKISTALTTAIPVYKRQSAGKLILVQ